ncbi:MAG: hypothetical protein IKB02_06155 [Clostridia bacterium]|nr:hypothetical protein [Clostridia bacterium]
MMNNDKTIIKKITAGVAVFIILCVCLCVTTLALVYAMVSVEDNVFESGFVKINLNGGEAVIDDPNLFFEPGMTIEKSFFVKNESKRPILYKLYFNALEGDLADIIEIEITDVTDPDNVEVLYTGVASELRRFNVDAVKTPIPGGETRDLVISFHLDESKNNEYQECGMTFDLCADAVQAENNPGGDFGYTTTAPDDTTVPEETTGV